MFGASSLSNARPMAIAILLLFCIINVLSINEKGLTIVPETDSNDGNDVPSTGNSKQDNVDIHIPNDDTNQAKNLNPQLVAALREINDDPTYLQQGNGELVDLSQFEMDPEKLEEMIEIFDWIESQLPPDDPQQIQEILNNVDQYSSGLSIVSQSQSDSNYTDESLLIDLINLPEFLYQVDNGVDFMKMNGIPILLKTYDKYNPLTLTSNQTNSSDSNQTIEFQKGINPTNTERNSTTTYQILAQIMDVMGVATQNNPNAIQYAHQSHLVSFIIDELDNIYIHYKEEQIPIHGQLINKLLFALSSIVRQSEVGLSHLQSKQGPKVLYQCGKLLSKEIILRKLDKMEEDVDINRAFKKLLTMVSDIVVLNRDRLEYSQMFLNSKKWCGFMIERGLVFHPEAVLQFIHHGIERNYCTDEKMVRSLEDKLNLIVEINTPKTEADNAGNENENEDEDEEEYYDESLLAQASNMLQRITQSIDRKKEQKTEL